jgi:hypothetical protein
VSTVSDPVDDLRALLDSLTSRVEAIEQRLNASPLRRADREALSRILPVLGATFGANMFLAAECITHDAAALRLVLAGLGTRSLGKLFGRANGHPVGGYVVRFEGAKEEGAKLWAVYRTMPAPS